MYKIRKNIVNITGYIPGEQPLQKKNVIKLNTNENPYPPSPLVKEILKKLDINELTRYPDPNCNCLREKIAEVYNLDKSYIIVGNGSDEILSLMLRTVVEPGEIITSIYPTYSLYQQIALIHGASYEEIELIDGIHIPSEFFTTNSSLKILCNPNPPLGTLFSKEIIAKICQKSNCYVIVDEAYIDFAPPDSTVIEMVKEIENLIVIRTLSKSFSLAGIRVGFGVANPYLIKQLFKVKDSYNVNFLSQKIALAAMEDIKWMRENVKKIVLSRKQLTQELRKMGFYVPESYGNFISAQPSSCSAKELYTKLKEKCIYVRYFDGKFVENFIRITVGTPEEIEVLLKEINHIICKN